jgi:HEAT repeat protein
VRGLAMQELAQLVGSNSTIREDAAQVFRAALEKPVDGWTTLSAARGMEQIVGPNKARAIWLELLRCGNPSIVADVALSLRDVAFAPALLDLLSAGAPTTEVKTAAMRALGRMHDPTALPAIAAQLARPPLRAHAIEALADLGDWRAVPHLRPYLTDTTDAWHEDNHGPMLRICDLAQSAIARLEAAM